MNRNIKMIFFNIVFDLKFNNVTCKIVGVNFNNCYNIMLYYVCIGVYNNESYLYSGHDKLEVLVNSI